MAMAFQVGDNVRINENASGNTHTGRVKTGRVERVYEDCDGVVSHYVRVDWGGTIHSKTTEIDTNLDNLSNISRKAP